MSKSQSKTMLEVPYYTTDDDSKWCGHIWRQRDRIGGIWGFAWEVLAPYDHDSPSAIGWRETQDDAERAMKDCLDRKEGA